MAISIRKDHKRSPTKLTIKADKLSSAMDEILSIYASNVTQAIKDATDETAEEVLQMVIERSPSDDGEYKAGWRWSTVFDSPLERKDAVHNQTSWPMIHLLEWGHVRKGWHFGEPYGRVPAHPHLVPAWEKGGQIFMEKVKEAIGDAD